ncbi:hypothetical protein JB92DRAFT_2909313 [Gautieria morchelliformis]|nr:hypothetical protein JB92DRAFT_2909313 [Gautieria morchelliformis]
MWPFSPSYTQRSVDTLEIQYDYIVVGGTLLHSSPSCVRRLSEDTGSTVLLIEKGDAGDSWLHRVPLTSHHHWSDRKHSLVFDSATDARLGRAFPLICGLGLGGSTRINGGQYTCGVPAEYDAWCQDGRTGWSYADLKPYFNKSEHWIGPAPREFHGLNGPLHVRSFADYHYACSERAAEAAGRMGFPCINDMHSPLEPGIGWNKMQFTIDSEGGRHSAFRAYLPDALARARSDRLHICTRAVACKIGFAKQADGTVRAENVEIASVDGRHVRTVTAGREIILTCGALRTPQLLMLSGIGPQDHLQELGIDVIKHSSGVGNTLEDHIYVTTTYNCLLADSVWSMVKRPTTLLRELYYYIRHGTGWLLGTMVELEIFGLAALISVDGSPHTLSKEQTNAADAKYIPDFSVMAVPIGDPRGPGIDRSKGFLGLNAALLKPKSQGRLRLGSRDPNAHPVCDMAYLTSPEDYATLRAALRVTVRLAAEMRAVGYPLDAVHVPDTLDDAALDAFIDSRAETMFHYSSSCRMARPDDDKPGVVDDQLLVHGISNLRIADASVFPTVPATHPQALIYAVAEKCADMILSTE